MDPHRLRGPGRWSWDAPRHPRTARRGPAAGLGLSRTSGGLDQGAVETLTRLGLRGLLRRRARGDGVRRPGPDDLATLIYTSRHDRAAQGLHAHARQLPLRARRRPRGSSTSRSPTTTPPPCWILPLAHVFARVVQVGAVGARVRLGHSADVDAPGRGPQPVPADVPAGPCRGSSRRCSTRPARRPPPTAAVGSSTGPPRPRSATAGRSRAAGRAGCCGCGTRCSSGWSTPGCARCSGGRCLYAVSGGAPLGERLGHFYRGIGVTVLEGYGLTETTAAVTVNRPDALKIGTVGRPLGGTAVRVADDGELLVRGGQVLGPATGTTTGATGEALDRDGWLAHRRPRRDRRRGLRAGDRPQEGDPGHHRRQERRPHRAGGPDPRAPAGQPVHGGRGRPAVRGRRWSPSTLEAAEPWAAAHGKTGPGRAAGRRPGPARRGGRRPVDEANKAVSQAESVRSSASCPGTGPRRRGSSPPASRSSGTW